MFSTISGSRTSSAGSSEADYLLRVLGTPAGEMAVWSGVAAGNDARCDAPNRARRSTPLAWIAVDELDAAAANVDEPFDPWPSTYALHQAARERRAEAIASVIRRAAGAMRGALLRVWKRYRQQRETRRIHDALRGLDDRTLRDLGFHRSEILSVACEASGAAERTRIRVRPRAPV
ncbi:MAG TPA: DUF1127 domain-containing protein [Casimicrobiaceae bacterium]